MMNEQEISQSIPDDDQVAAELRSAVHAGDVAAIQRLIRNDPALATARLGSKDSGHSDAVAPSHRLARLLP